MFCYCVSKLTTATRHGWVRRCCLVCEMPPENIPKTSRKHPQNIQKTSPRYPENIPKTSRKHPENIQKTSPNDPENIHQSSRKHPQIIQKTSQNIPPKHFKTYPKTCVCIL